MLKIISVTLLTLAISFPVMAKNKNLKNYKKNIIGEWIYTKNLITNQGKEIPVNQKIEWVFTEDKHYIIIDGKKSKTVDYDIYDNILSANGDNQTIKFDNRGLIIISNEVEMILFKRKK